MMPYMLTTEHGPTYRAAKFFAAVAAFFAASFGMVSALDTTSTLEVKVLVAGAFILLWGATVAWVVLARRERTLVVDEVGIHVSRNGRTHLDVPWDAVDRVEYGTMAWVPVWPKWVLDPKDVLGRDWHMYLDAHNPRRFLLPYLSIESPKTRRKVRIVERLVDDVPVGTVAAALQAVKAFAAVEHAGFRYERTAGFVPPSS